MKKILILCLLISSTIKTNCQTAQEFFEKGNLAMKNPDSYRFAIIDYTKAIELDSTFTLAYSNRGIARLSIEEYKEALLDFSKVIQLKPKNEKAYVRRGFVKFQINDIDGAILDFIKANDLDAKILTQDYGTDQKFPDFYILRGLAKIHLNQRENGCLDIHKAKNLGSKRANDFIQKNCIELNLDSINRSAENIDKELAEFLAGPKLEIQSSGVKVSADNFSKGIPFATTSNSASDKRNYTDSELKEANKPENIIGKPIKIGKLLVAQNEFPKKSDWNNAKAACSRLGTGWRLPTKDELFILYQNKNILRNFSKYGYWSSTEGIMNGNNAVAYYQDFTLGSTKPILENKLSTWGVRAVKSL